MVRKQVSGFLKRVLKFSGFLNPAFIVSLKFYYCDSFLLIVSCCSQYYFFGFCRQMLCICSFLFFGNQSNISNLQLGYSFILFIENNRIWYHIKSFHLEKISKSKNISNRIILYHTRYLRHSLKTKKIVSSLQLRHSLNPLSQTIVSTCIPPAFVFGFQTKSKN